MDGNVHLVSFQFARLKHMNFSLTDVWLNIITQITP